MIKLIIFDLDGTLINAYPAVEETLNYTLGRFGLSPIDSDTIKRTVGWGDRQLVQTFVGEERIDKAIAIYREHHAGALLRGSSLLPGALRLLKFLKKQGYRLAVASNRPKKYSLIVMEHLKIFSFFECVLCGDELERPKPYPDILLSILEKMHFEAAQTVFVGDMVIDIETGRAAKIRTIAVTTGSCSLAELEEARPWKIINRVDELENLLGE
jgi:phosphoglycolate phosphatase